MFDAIKAYIAQFKLYFGIALLTAAFCAGGYAVHKWNQAKIERLVTDQAVCRDANTSSQAAIDSLKKDVNDAHSRCNSQLAAKDRTIKALKKIDEAKGGTSNEEGSGSSGNALLDLANGVFSRPDHKD